MSFFGHFEGLKGGWPLEADVIAEPAVVTKDSERPLKAFKRF